MTLKEHWPEYLMEAAGSEELQQALERTIKRQIVQRTWGRIQALEVKVSHKLVVVRGRAPSYYVEQLALQGVLDVIESAGAPAG